MSQTAKKALQNTLRNDLGSNLVVVNRKIESVATSAYCTHVDDAVDEVAAAATATGNAHA